MEIKTLKKRVEHCLQEYPKTRDCDVTLTIQVWREFYRERIETNCVRFDQLFFLPSQDSIKRVRAKLQNNDMKYPPTTWEVAKKRQMNEDKWREAMVLNN